MDRYPTTPGGVARLRLSILGGVAGCFSLFGLIMFVGGLIGLESRDWNGPLKLVTKGATIAQFENGTTYLIPTLVVTVILGAVSIIALTRLVLRPWRDVTD